MQTSSDDNYKTTYFNLKYFQLDSCKHIPYNNLTVVTYQNHTPFNNQLITGNTTYQLLTVHVAP